MSSDITRNQTIALGLVPTNRVATWVIVDFTDFYLCPEGDQTVSNMIIEPRFYDKIDTKGMKVIEEITVDKCHKFCKIKQNGRLKIQLRELFSSVKNLILARGIGLSTYIEWHFHIKCYFVEPPEFPEPDSWERIFHISPYVCCEWIEDNLDLLMRVFLFGTLK